MTPTEIICAAIVAILSGNGLLTWWLQTRLEHRLKKEMVEHESEIKDRYDKQIETLKSQLSKDNFRFSKVFDSTEKAIVPIYQQIIQLKSASGLYTMSQNQRELEAFDKLAFELWKYFQDNKLYIPKKTAERIEKILMTLNAANTHFAIALNEARQPNRPEESYGTIFTNYQKIEDQIPKLLEALADDFQDILGFPMQDKSIK